MKFDLLGLSITPQSQYVSLFSLMFSGQTPNGTRAPGLTRHLFFLGYDPIGWRFQIFFLILFSERYEKNFRHYIGLMKEQRNHPNGRPQKTGGLQA